MVVVVVVVVMVVEMVVVVLRIVEVPVNPKVHLDRLTSLKSEWHMFPVTDMVACGVKIIIAWHGCPMWGWLLDNTWNEQTWVVTGEYHGEDKVKDDLVEVR